jgi:hypothetical protein
MNHINKLLRLQINLFWTAGLFWTFLLFIGILRKKVAMKLCLRFSLIIIFLLTALLGMPGRVLADPIDGTAPITTLIINGTPGSAGWYKTGVSVRFYASDPNPAPTGVAVTEYRLNGGDWQTFTSEFPLGAGITTIEYRSKDVAGNWEIIRSSVIRVDLQAPVVSASFQYPVLTQGQTQVVYFSASDDLSGVASLTALLDGSPVTNGSSIPATWLSVGTHVMVVTATDVAGNSTTQQVSFEVVGVASSSLESLRATTQRLCAERGITNKGLCQSFDNKLALAIKMRDQGKPKQVSLILTHMREEIRIQSSKPRNASITQAAAKLLTQEINSILQQLAR